MTTTPPDLPAFKEPPNLVHPDGDDWSYGDYIGSCDACHMLWKNDTIEAYAARLRRLNKCTREYLAARYELDQVRRGPSDESFWARWDIHATAKRELDEALEAVGELPPE